MLLNYGDHYRYDPPKLNARQLASLKALPVEDLAYSNLLAYNALMVPGYKVAPHNVLIAEHLMAVERGEILRLAIFMPPRHGKNCANSTPVLTLKGWKKHGDLCPGDYVYGPDGKPVLITFRSHEEICDIDVEFTNGEIITVNKKHLWTVYDRRSCPQPLRTLETQELAKDVWIGKKGARGGRARWQLPDIQAIEHPFQELPMHPYVLGAWLGDGSSSQARMAHDVKDQEVINKIVYCGYDIQRQYIQENTGVQYTLFGSGKSFVSSQFTNDLHAINVFNNKHIPEIYLRSSIEQRLELLAGLIDTDGHVEAKTSRVRFSTCSEQLRDDVFDLAVGLGFRPYVVACDPCVSSSGIVGKQIVYQVGFQPDIDIPTQIPRKKIKKFAKRRRVAIKDIRPAKKPEMGHCIKVNRKDGLYLVGKQLVVTHNTMLASELFPSWYLGRNPEKQIIATTYSHDRASDVGRNVRGYMIDPLYKEIFPDSKISADSKSANKISFVKGGNYFSVGVGGAIVGRGAHCLASGTIISTDERPLRIETLHEMNFRNRPRVLSFNHNNGQQSYESIIATRKLDSDGIIFVDIEKCGRILATSDHKFFVPDFGYVFAKDLHVGTKLLDNQSRMVRVKKLEFCTESIPVYDIQVANNENFYANGVLVHNCFLIDDPIRPLAADTPIPIPGGWKLMGDLQIGDKVFDHTGKPCRVINKTPRYIAPRYRVKFSDGSFIDAHPDHLWMAFDRSSHSVYTNGIMRKGIVYKRKKYSDDWYKWETSGKSKIQQVTTKKIKDSLIARQTMRNWTIPNALPLNLPDVDLPVDPYILGYWLGDGSKRDPSFTVFHTDIDNFINQVKKRGYHVLSKNKKNGSETYTLYVSEKPTKSNKWENNLCKKLVKLGVINDKHIPPIYLRSSYRQRLDLLRGLMDSDGGTEPDHGEVVFSSVRKELAYNVYELIVSLGGKTVLCKKETGWQPIYLLRGFYPFQPFLLPRKAAMHNPNGQIRRVNRTIVDVEILEETEHLCITVDSPSHLFLAGRAMVPTCNSRIDAESKLIQKKLRNWYRSVAFTRLMPGNSAIVVILTRWSFWDLPGWLLQEHKHENWVVLELPAVATEDNDPIGRRHGEALWPSEYPVKRLEAIKRSVGTREWNSQYQQNPLPEEGGMLQLNWFKQYGMKDLFFLRANTKKYANSVGLENTKQKLLQQGRKLFHRKADYPRHFVKIVCSWDTAFKPSDLADPSACTVWGVTNNNLYYLLWVVNEHLEFPDLVARAKQVHERSYIKNCLPFGAVSLLIEDKASGQSLIQELKRSTRIPIIPYTPKGDKTIRFSTVTNVIESGRIFVPRQSKWIVDYQTQLIQFPLGRNDDMVDSTSQFLDYIQKPKLKKANQNIYWK